MTGEPNNNDNTTTPQTPPRRDSHIYSDAEGSGKVTTVNSKNKPDLAPGRIEDQVLVADASTPPQPFLAYARRIRSFSSPFQLNKSRYLLTFTTEAAASEWWTLMQSEYPDSVRESSQLFSFKSDRVPRRAWENPKFIHLKDKWTWRQLDDSDKEKGVKSDKQSGGLSATAAKKGMIRRVSMPIVREVSPSPELVRDADEGLEDPFTPNGGPDQEKTGLAQLSITSDRIHKSVSVTSSNIDALLEGQQAGAKGMQKMQAAMEKVTSQVELLAQKQEADDDGMLRLQFTVSQSVAELKTLSDRSQLDAPSGEDLRNLQAEVAENSAQLKALLEGQKTAKKGIQKMQAILDQQVATQKLLAEQMQALHSANVQNQAFMKTMASSQNARFDQLLSSLEKHTSQTREAMKSQQGALKSTRDDIISTIREETPSCGHEVVPPPRKVGRKIVGYVYSRSGS